MNYQTLFQSMSPPVRYCRLIINEMQYHYAVSFGDGQLQAVTIPDNEEANDDN